MKQDQRGSGMKYKVLEILQIKLKSHQSMLYAKEERCRGWTDEEMDARLGSGLTANEWIGKHSKDCSELHKCIQWVQGQGD